MELKWEFAEQDFEKIRKLIEKNNDKTFFKNRLAKNIEKKVIISERDKIWKCIIICLLTSQQNSSAESPISRYSRQKPFPLELENCKSNSENLDNYISSSLKLFGGIRFYDRIANLLTKNFENLQKKFKII